MRMLVPVAATFPRTFAEWGLAVTFIKAPDGTIYLSVREVSEELGLDLSSQLTRMRLDPDLIPGVVEMRIATPTRGMQKSVCIRRKEAAWWLATIEAGKVKKPEIRTDLKQIRQVLIQAADALLFGDIQHTESDKERGMLAMSSRQDYTIACLECGAIHQVIIVNGEPTVALKRE